MTLSKLLLSTVAALSIATAGHAASVTADATGINNQITPGFWGVAFTGTSGFLASVTFDLTGTSNDYFDFDGVGSFQDEMAPVFTGLVGLTLGDITVQTSGGLAANRPQILTLNFAAGSFGVGDSLRFGADVDQIVSGDAFDGSGATFSATLEAGPTGSAFFSQTGANSSEAVVNLAPSVVPLPAGLPLLLTGVLGFALAKRRRKETA